MNENFVAKFWETFKKFRVINEQVRFVLNDISLRRTEISCERNEILFLKSF